MKTKYKKYLSIEEAISYLVALMYDRFGYSFKAGYTIKTSNKIGGYSMHDAVHKFLDDPSIVQEYKEVERTPKEKEKYLKKQKKNKFKPRGSFQEIFENENVKMEKVKNLKANVIMTIEIMREIKNIISQFPDDFICNWKYHSFGQGEFTLYYIQSFGTEPVAQEIVFKFLERHCKTKGKDEIFEISSELTDSVNNQRLVEMFRNISFTQHKRETTCIS